MTKSQGTAMLFLLILIIVLLAYNVYSTTMSSYEYKIDSFSDYSFDVQMEILGNQGWELVFARRATSGSGYYSTAQYECIFKRPTILK